MYIALRAVPVKLFLPLHHVCLAPVFLDEPADAVAAFAGALGALDAEHVEFSFDVTEDEIGSPSHNGDITTCKRDRRCLMAEKPTEGGRKLVEFDAPIWHGLNLLLRESMKSFQELADEAFRDLLHKRPTNLKSALRESAKGAVSGRRRQAR
jgi:hypothetical protein